METNELPEEAKLKILMEVVEKANKRWMYSQPDDLAEAAEFGYRLALQSKEEELEGLKDEIETAREWMKVHEGENSKYLQIQEQLKAKDELLSKVRNVIDREIRVVPSWEARKQLLTEIESLLSQSTDKP